MTNDELNKSISAQILAVNYDYPKKLLIEVEYEGNLYQADDHSFLQMIFAISQIEFPSNFYWLDSTNKKIFFTKEKMQALTNLVFLKRFSIFDAHQKHKDKIRNAKSIQEIFK